MLSLITLSPTWDGPSLQLPYVDFTQAAGQEGYSIGNAVNYFLFYALFRDTRCKP
jgi:hypothetical protein